MSAPRNLEFLTVSTLNIYAKGYVGRVDFSKVNDHLFSFLTFRDRFFSLHQIAICSTSSLYDDFSLWLKWYELCIALQLCANSVNSYELKTQG